MAFLKKKRVKFLVDFEVNKLTDVPLLNATLFAKVRLLDGGSSFESFTNHGKVEAHTVILGPKFNFSVRIPSDASTGQLEDCKCKISVRKEDRGGRTPVKIGYVIVNLSEFAASGVNEIKQSYLLDGYTGRQRQDNSRVHIHVRMIHQGADPLFKVPNMAITSSEEAQLNPADRKAPSRTTAATIDEKAKALIAEPIAVPRTQSVAPSSSSTPILQPMIERSSWHGVTSSTDTTSIASSNATTSNTVASTFIGTSLPPASGSPQLPSGVIERTTLPSSSATTITTGKSTVRRMSDDRLSATINRVTRTRHDANDVIDEVIAETSVLHGRTRTSTNEEDDDNKNGLALFVSKDGEAVVGQNSMYSPPSLQRIHIADASLAGL
uniref:C2 NT-type domain-containing protein n=1 Tax=Panagrolaimus sp. ES5 TaxID=591445 RepID=A0AC34GXP5_9BILA